MKNRRILFALVSIGLLLGFQSCKTTGSLVSKLRQGVAAQEMLESNDRIDKMNAKWTFASSNIKVGGQISCGPSSLWLNSQFLLGIETHRLYADKSLVQFIDRTQRVYVSDSLAQMSLPVGMIVNLARGILCNEIVDLSGEPLSLREAEYKFDERRRLLLSYRAPFSTVLEYTIDENGDFTEMRLIRNENELLKVVYSNFLVVDGIRFPHMLHISSKEAANAGMEFLQFFESFDIVYRDVHFDTEAKTSFSIPSNYNKLDAQTLLKSIKLF